MHYLLLPPAIGLLAGLVYIRRLPSLRGTRNRLSHVAQQWRIMTGLGFAFMIGGAAILVGQLAVRVVVERELGAVGMGLVQAVWAISITYIGFVLQAMAADYSPRLTEAISDRQTANRLVNEQTEIALLLCAPVLLVMLGAAPWVLQLFYSRDFTEAAMILRWQVMGDLLKVASWPMGFILIAIGDGRTFIFTEVSSAAVFVLFAWIGIPLIGIEAAGLAFLAMYLFYLPLLYLIARTRTGFSWSKRVRLTLAVIIATCSAVFASSTMSSLIGLGAGLFFAATAGIAAAYRLKEALPKRFTTILDGKRGA